ncbi:BQ5605_C016g08101 [Microbotryum silenes-dioicae]|uniref:Large ribosomal subunit protein mL46 n=1 Tax=Microbotryum silenes-dioicae TaxID=796604 RepID=A0A2X0NZD0_9BASI|nr:BQ5605_C016g08101 [Microbotryum silenes-dioicae]
MSRPAASRTLHQITCSCIRPVQLQTRLASTSSKTSSASETSTSDSTGTASTSSSASTPSSSSSSTSSSSSSSPRIVAAALISRPPLLLPSLTAFERTYYAYQRRIARALAKPVSVSTSWFFKPNSTTEKSFSAYDQATTAVDTGLENPMRDFELAGEQVEGAAELVQRQTEADEKGDLKSLERKGDRTLYMLLKKDRNTHAWQFPQGGVEGDESLLEAAQRELIEETGPNMDVWPIGKVPAGAYSYPFPKEHLEKKPEHTEARVFFLPMRIVRGQAVPNKKEGLVDFAWLTKEEIREKVSQGYWEAVEPMLSDV